MQENKVDPDEGAQARPHPHPAIQLSAGNEEIFPVRKCKQSGMRITVD